MLDLDEQSLRQRLKDDLPHFASRCLKIRPREGGEPVPLILNDAQTYLHQRAEAQKKRIGMVRIIVVKGRQQGVSSYIGARFYHQATHFEGTKVFILTHMDDATDNLFKMVERYHEHNNPLLKPITGASNAKELSFKLMDSGYAVGTAGSKGVGRSDTLQKFHGSEVAFWPHADDHVKGALQAVAVAPGTEVFLESTANGIGNLFHDEWTKATAGKSLFEPVFIPWFWERSYRVPVGDNFAMEPDEAEYAEAYGLDKQQIAWMRLKRVEFGKAGFQQEYPATAQEAFEASGEGCFISPVQVSKARRTKVDPSSYVPLIIGVDPARGGGDKTGVIDRQGRAAGKRIFEEWDEPDLMVVAGKVANLIRKFKPARVFVDVTGLGAGVYDRLVDLQFGRVVQGVNFASRSSDDERWANRRAEMWDEMRQWFSIEAGVQCPDNDMLQGDVCAPIWDKGATRVNSAGALVIEDKEHIRKRLKRSPSLGDALALTFASPVSSEPQTAFMPQIQVADPIVGY